jgi:hypothetical protein
VTIENLTVNGNNPNLTSTVTTNGVQIDARNGIIGDFNTSPGVFNNMVVQNVTAENIYLRGIYASTGGTFDFNHDTVTNVESDPSSVAMFNFGGSGNMSYNTVSYAGDAISSNWSGGVTFEHNTVTQSGSGIHTDNSNGFGTNVADIIKYNTISSCTTDGYGVWDFVPYVAPVISNNTVTGCAVGLGSFGSANPVTTVFTHNIVDGTGATVSSGSSIGAYISTTEFGFGDSNVNATLTSNTITHFGEAADVEQTGSGPVPTVAFHFNRLTGNAGGMINNASTAVNASDNWWGCNAGPGNPGCDPVGGTGIVGQNPWLVLNLASAPSTTTSSAALTADLTHDNNGTDTSSSGFLPDGTVVGFSTNLGHLSASSASTVNGKAAVNLSPAGQFGTATATATLDNQSVSTSVALTRPSLSINSVSQVSGSSGTTPMTFTVSLSSASDTQITVHYATINWWATSSGTGFANPDFDAASGTLTFPPGTTTQPVTVTLHGYPANEANEPFKVDLSAPSANATIANGVGIGSILNNNPLPIVTVSPPPSSVVAGSPAVFTINLSAASDQTVTVNYNTSDVSARQPVDYKATIGTATFPHGTTHVTVSVPTVHDASPDGTETFKLLLTSPKHATGHWPNWATATIAAH